MRFEELKRSMKSAQGDASGPKADRQRDVSDLQRGRGAASTDDAGTKETDKGSSSVQKGDAVGHGKRHKVNWANTLFLTITPAVALAGTIWWLAAGRFNLATVVFAVVLAYLTGGSITAGYHRLFSHRSYQTIWPVRLALILFGGGCFEGSVWEWCVDHRRHHKHIDSDKDPYNIKEGFWHAHILWLFFKTPENSRRECQDLWRDPMVRFQHWFYLPLASLVCFALPAGIASLWGDALGGLFVAGFLRLVVNQHVTFAINSVCHYFGKQTYSTSHSARDNWFTALFTYGEGFHNFHHEFPVDYRNGIRCYHWDPTKWFIGLLGWLGLAKNLVRVAPETICLRKMAVKEARLKASLPDEPGAVQEFATNLLEATRRQVDEAAERLKDLRVQYRSLTRAKQTRVAQQYRVVRKQLRYAEREFRQTVALWESVARRVTKLVAANSRVAGVVGA